ncbi:hypothetical protein F2P81_002306 [Scophthalmus maximus]|uniref:Uncharacterized protein n=1 Tax=Scophthalmus maximus TaxID=52904 RepID=A0A6A4TGH1_SCOMX|nr:hypothetical protein F2P81_002306 [Scophthalmus maximus]
MNHIDLSQRRKRAGKGTAQEPCSYGGGCDGPVAVIVVPYALLFPLSKQVIPDEGHEVGGGPKRLQMKSDGHSSTDMSLVNNTLQSNN